MENRSSRLEAREPVAPSRRSLPPLLRLELEAVRRILDALHTQGKACLDIGFREPEACASLRAAGGYWTSVAADRDTRARLAEAMREEIQPLGAGNLLPFEDKQFDAVVLALGALSGDRDTDTALVRECHRVLKVPGYLILTVEFAKPFGLADLLNRRRRVDGTGGRYSEAALFDLLKTGFDWLGVRHFCRFWTQMVRHWAVRRRSTAGGAPLASPFYWTARQMDRLLFFSGGYVVTAYGRRKGWRPRATPTLTDGRSIPEAVLQHLGR